MFIAVLCSAECHRHVTLTYSCNEFSSVHNILDYCECPTVFQSHTSGATVMYRIATCPQLSISLLDNWSDTHARVKTLCWTIQPQCGWSSYHPWPCRLYLSELTSIAASVTFATIDAGEHPRHQLSWYMSRLCSFLYCIMPAHINYEIS